MKDNFNFAMLITAVVSVIGGLIWGGIQQYIMEWDHALGRGEKFHMWFHLWVSPGLLVLFGLLILLILRVRRTI